VGRDDNDGHFDIPFRRLTLHRCNTSTSSQHLNSMGKVADSSPCNQICSSSFSDCRNGAFEGDLNRRRRAVPLISMDRHQAAAGTSNRGSVPRCLASDRVRRFRRPMG